MYRQEHAPLTNEGKMHFALSDLSLSKNVYVKNMYVYILNQAEKIFADKYIPTAWLYIITSSLHFSSASEQVSYYI